MATVRWNIAVSAEIDQAVRLFVAARGGGRKGDLSRFIEEVVRAYLLDELRRACRHPKIAPLLPAHQLETLFSTRHHIRVLENVRMPSLLFNAPDPADALLLKMAYLGFTHYLVTQRPAGPLQRHLVTYCHQVVSVEGMIATAIGTSAGHTARRIA